LRTKDHKRPKIYGGTERVANIVRCCRMCNSIKGSRPYGLFAALFGEFLDEHGAEYRASDPDDWVTVGAMSHKFNAWLYARQHAPEAAPVS
jgi:hypothetical protein